MGKSLTITLALIFSILLCFNASAADWKEIFTAPAAAWEGVSNAPAAAWKGLFNASAADWKEIDKATYFDASRIVKTDKGTILVSIKFKLSENAFKEKASIYNKSYNDYAYTMQDVELKCDSSQSSFEPINHYDIIGTFTMFSTDKDTFTTALPDSTGEFNPAKICNYTKKWHI